MKLTLATLVAFLSAYTAAAPLSVEDAASKVIAEFEKYGSEAKDAAEPLVADVQEFAKPVTDEIEKGAGDFSKEVESGFSD
ncbi:hypothetical protein LTS12_028483, partial [Elasticomyces elasticus]